MKYHTCNQWLGSLALAAASVAVAVIADANNIPCGVSALVGVVAYVAGSAACAFGYEDGDMVLRPETPRSSATDTHDMMEQTRVVAVNVLALAGAGSVGMQLVWERSGSPTTSWLWYPVELLVCTFAAEVWFFTWHWVLHVVPFLWRHVHQKHHRARAPVAWQSLYCTWYENILVNLCTLVLGPVLLRMEPSHFLAWSVTSTLVTLVSHSGLMDAYGLMDARAHDAHHQFGNAVKTRGNYGFTGVLDWLCGTRCSAVVAASAAVRKQLAKKE